MNWEKYVNWKLHLKSRVLIRPWRITLSFTIQLKILLWSLINGIATTTNSLHPGDWSNAFFFFFKFLRNYFKISCLRISLKKTKTKTFPLFIWLYYLTTANTGFTHSNMKTGKTDWNAAYLFFVSKITYSA